MGSHKWEMEVADARGWQTPDGHVCAKCVGDDYLKALIRQHANRRQCEYCGARTRSHSAAPVAILMEPIARAVFHYFDDPTQAGVAYEGEWMAPLVGTHDVLMAVQLDCHEQLFEDIAQAFVYQEWVHAADGSWTAEHPHEELSALWDNFVSIIKHEVRFFFHRAPSAKPDHLWEPDPRRILRTIGDLAKRMTLIRQFPAGHPLFRVRAREEGANWEVDDDQMGAPPSELARAGRMNPAGISYMYLAFEQETALAEVLSGPPCAAAIAQFTTQRELQVLDLTSLPEEPSIFDESRRDEREALLFLERFVEAISQPVRKDGGEHIGYVPSQVVCEYFALVFQVARHRSLDGIVYPSAVRPGGRNLVLFPTERGFKRDFDQIAYQGAWEQTFPNWAAFTAALNT